MTGVKRKILVLGPLPPPWFGPAVATEAILSSPLRDRCDLVPFDTGTHRELATLGKVRAGRLLRQLLLFLRFPPAVLSARPDLVFVPVSQTTAGFVKDSFYVVASRLLGRRVLLILRGGNFKGWLDGASEPTRRWVRFVLGTTEGIVALGEANRAQFEGWVDEGKVFSALNGADFPPPPERAERTGREGTVALSLGSLQESKGVEDLVEAAALAAGKATGGALRFVAAGGWRDGSLQRRCEDAVAKRGIPLSFPGVAAGEAKRSLLAEADLFIFCSREPEGHPWAIVEAMAAGLPVVATDRGAVAESVLDGVNGFVVPPGRPDLVAEKVGILAGDRRLRQVMGRASRRLYEERFTAAEMAESLYAAFEISMS